MLLPELSPKSKARLKAWLKLPLKIIQRLPDRDRADMKAAIEKYAKLNLARSQISKYNTIRSLRLGRDRRQITQFIVILAGSLTFSVAPQLLAKQVGRGPMAISAGLLGGGLASFYAHANATKVLTGIKLKNQTQNTRKAIADQNK
ncbi:hypothetical protein WA1_26725 [Scytonema hofmannii PCC 7110]|jgi:hypothetical protein|uniref:Uncharacterized protein n=1 Tax=Scytonema hofmannii PCC 7110 TaxID=128403 RepID=A0A139X6S8_9CYAN|nr:hypothetical protein [Scytonema hofmannii]KYC40409.1 hypothetical protein WA1_26725 [Scytonema hofmannii PCC 7110]